MGARVIPRVLFSARDVGLAVGDARIFLESLPMQSVDVTITDPPYSKHVHGNQRRGKHEIVSATRKEIDGARDLGFTHLGAELRALVAREIVRTTRRWSLVFSDNENAHLWIRDLEREGHELVRLMHWHKRGGAPQFTGDRPAVACETIVLTHAAGRKRWNGGGRQGFFSIPPERSGRIHTTQKPIALMRELVELFTEPGETICDPFAGSATTLVAAMQLGRRAIGCELDPEAAALAADRLAGERLKLHEPGKLLAGETAASRETAAVHLPELPE